MPVKRSNGYQMEGRRPALCAGLRPQLELWLGLTWLGAETFHINLLMQMELVLETLEFYNSTSEGFCRRRLY